MNDTCMNDIESYREIERGEREHASSLNTLQSADKQRDREMPWTRSWQIPSTYIVAHVLTLS